MKDDWRTDYYALDVEIAKEVKSVPGGWNNPEAMGFGSAVVYGKKEDRYWFFVHNEGRDAMIKLLNGRHVVSFNGIKFDSRVVLDNDRALFPSEGLVMKGPVAWANYDILAEYVVTRFNLHDVEAAEKKLGERGIHDGTFNLDALCRHTLGCGKSGHGAEAPLLYQAGKFGELLEYNLQDVRITRKLYEFILDYGFVVDGAQRITYLYPPGENVRWTPPRP
jgi:hypothetical protein